MGADCCKTKYTPSHTVRNASTNNAVETPPPIDPKGLHRQDPVKQSAVMSAAAAECDAQQSADQELLRVQEANVSFLIRGGRRSTRQCRC